MKLTHTALCANCNHVIKELLEPTWNDLPIYWLAFCNSECLGQWKEKEAENAKALQERRFDPPT